MSRVYFNIRRSYNYSLNQSKALVRVKRALRYWWRSFRLSHSCKTRKTKGPRNLCTIISRKVACSCRTPFYYRGSVPLPYPPRMHCPNRNVAETTPAFWESLSAGRSALLQWPVLESGEKSQQFLCINISNSCIFANCLNSSSPRYCPPWKLLFQLNPLN